METSKTTPATPQRQPKRAYFLKRVRQLLFASVCLATLIGLFYAEENIRGKLAWESYVKKARAKGIEVDWRAYVPPAVPDEQNFAMTPLFVDLFNYEHTPTNAHWHNTNIWKQMERVSFQSTPREAGKSGPSPSMKAPVEHLADWMRGRTINLEEWQEYFRKWSLYGEEFKLPKTNYWAVSPGGSDPAKDILSALHKIDSDLDELREAAVRPQSRFPLHYEDMAETLLPHLAYLNNFASAFELRSLAELQLGDNQEACADTMFGFRCADAVESEAFLVSQMVRCRILNDSLQAVWEGIGTHRWTEGQLEEFQRYLVRQDLLARYELARRAETAFLCGILDKLSQSLPSLANSLENGPEALVIPRGWVRQNEVFAARFFNETASDDVSDSLQRVYPERSAANGVLFNSTSATPSTFIVKITGFMGSAQEFARTQTDLNFALVACALERYRIVHGAYPKMLSDIAPEYIAQIPHDLINGEPLRYRLEEGGNFILYSIGWDGKDDGGAFPWTPKPPSKSVRDTESYYRESGDWVWKYPATR